MNLKELKDQIQSLPEIARSKPDKVFPVTFDLYRDERIEGTSLGNDGDMLLFQWGTYDWGAGRHFELDLTRQAILEPEDPDEDPEILQLRCTFRYAPELFADLPSGNRWCYSPEDVQAFSDFVLSSPGLALALQREPASLVVRIDSVE
jgi:hypothetical protein